MVNFWLYDEAEFQLSEGRLILRGPNGSGKSVTMQSFLPLVLDGDKRPNRLDPFGSRDRKIEYYMLGEGNSGHSDRTGYLYLEFVDPSVNKYLTVGIGLRARRGAPSVSFWGFAITDQRRIGHDFFLYQQEGLDVGTDKVPLDRPSLEAEIGSGGRVMRDQREYQNLVNQLLFGFDDLEAYKELLGLLIQLRSPKLSKEHRPSVIYEILNAALPPLADEDLRPLASVLEDLDEISDRLLELAQHRADLQSLVSAYDQYNRMRLYDLSSRALERHSEVTSRQKDAAERAHKHEALEAQVAALGERVVQVRKELMETEATMETINRSEVMEKQREYENIRQRLEDMERQQHTVIARRDEAVRDKDVKATRLRTVEGELARLEREAAGLQEHLTALAFESEFTGHHVYAANWSDLRFAEPVPDEVWSGLKRDLQEHEANLREARRLGQQERQERDKVETAEKILSEARERRDNQERVVSEQQKAFEKTLEAQVDEMLVWYQSLLHLQIADEQWRESLRSLQRYPEVPYNELLAPIQSALGAVNADIESRRADATHQKGQLEQARAERLAELAEWQSQREPEPPQSEAQTKARQRRTAGGTKRAMGAPLYALCEFQPKVDEQTRAALETALHQAGVLDAWVSPEWWEQEGGLRANEALYADEEDAFIRPNPLLFGETLAEYLTPTPTEESGLTAQQVDDVLRTIVLSDLKSNDEAPPLSQMLVTTDGHYQIGPLSGVALVKPQAEWIGVEARRRTRLANIERLQAEISLLEEKMKHYKDVLQALLDERRAVRDEFSAFPSEEPLRRANDTLVRARYVLDSVLDAESKANDAFREAARRLRERQQQFVEFTSKWQHLRRLDDFEDALEKLHSYEVGVPSLQSAVTGIARASGDLRALTEELERLEDRIDVEDLELKSVATRLRELTAHLQALDEMLEASGFRDLVAELDALRKRQQVAKQLEEQLVEDLANAREGRGQSQEALRQAQLLLAEAEDGLYRVARRLESEWQLGFVEPAATAIGAGGETEAKALEKLVRAARDYTRQERSRYESRQIQSVEKRLQEVFSLTQSSLRDYALDETYDENRGRWLILSYRDKVHPLTPAGLLREMEQQEEEQRSLIGEKDRKLYEQILLHSVGNAIRDKINRAELWVKEMNRFMGARKTSSGFALALDWVARPASSEDELDTDLLVNLLRRSPETLRQIEIDQMMNHFRSRINRAKELAEDGVTLRQSITSLLDYRTWFRFKLSFKKGDAPYHELTDSRFNVLSGGEKAMAMYIPLFAATDSRYKDSRPNAPRILSLDEAFAGVDEKNMRDMFELLTDMEFDYMMTSQVLWGCYETVPSLSIYEVHRPNDADFVTLFPYYWNGKSRSLVMDDDWESVQEVAAAQQSQ